VTVETSYSCTPVNGSPILQELPASLERKRNPESCSCCISVVISAHKLLRKIHSPVYCEGHKRVCTAWTLTYLNAFAVPTALWVRFATARVSLGPASVCLIEFKKALLDLHLIWCSSGLGPRTGGFLHKREPGELPRVTRYEELAVQGPMQDGISVLHVTRMYCQCERRCSSEHISELQCYCTTL
jgi:hypothetical protein